MIDKIQSIVRDLHEHSKSRKPFSPCRALAPLMFVLCHDWSNGVKVFPSKEISSSGFLFFMFYTVTL
uniref:Uncharacterized protein n=1 Tax=Cajanus cajan TaxID=3821 RepID=A0A151TAJ1_CAJCA|nr:hypothetical protein KK1_018648 [Cajanus cajan]